MLMFRRVKPYLFFFVVVFFILHFARLDWKSLVSGSRTYGLSFPFRDGPMDLYQYIWCLWWRRVCFIVASVKKKVKKKVKTLWWLIFLYSLIRKENLRVFSFFILQWFPDSDRPVYCFGKHGIIIAWVFGMASLEEVCDDFWLPCYV